MKSDIQDILLFEDYLIKCLTRCKNINVSLFIDRGFLASH